MAHRLTLPRGAAIPFIWNVSGHVGDHQSRPNQPTDVNLVKYLFTAVRSFGHSSPMPPGLVVTLPQDGRFDVSLAYSILRYQRSMRQVHPDGVISPAKATAQADSTWVIGRLNSSLFLSNRRLFESLPDAPGLDPLLRHELMTARL